jgi:uncharacterized membrane protein
MEWTQIVAILLNSLALVFAIFATYKYKPKVKEYYSFMKGSLNGFIVAYLVVFVLNIVILAVDYSYPDNDLV